MWVSVAHAKVTGQDKIKNFQTTLIWNICNQSTWEIIMVKTSL